MDDATKELQKSLKELSETYKSISKTEFVKSGSVVLDALLGGGIPKGVFILWSAANGCGKSTGALHVSRSYCLQGKRVLYLDVEGGVNDSQIDGMGLREFLWDENTNPNGLFYCFRIHTYKDAEKVLDKIMTQMDLVVFDSTTSIITEKQKESSSEDVLPGIDARVMSVFLKRYKADAVRNDVSWILINQMRTKIAMSYGQVTHDEEAGGNALKHYVDIRLVSKKDFKGDLTRKERTASGEQDVPYGAICSTWAEKNRYARPKVPLKLAIIFGKGISNDYAYSEWLLTNGIVKKSGAWFTIKLGDIDTKVQGIGKVIDWIKQNKELVKTYINSNGGYKLLLDSADAVDLVSDDMDVVQMDENTLESSVVDDEQ